MLHLSVEEEENVTKLEEWIREHKLDEGARRALRRLHYDEANALMSKLKHSIRRHPNKNALVMKHLNTIQMKCGRRFFGQTTVRERVNELGNETEKVAELLGVKDDDELELVDDVNDPTPSKRHIPPDTSYSDQQTKKRRQEGGQVVGHVPTASRSRSVSMDDEASFFSLDEAD